MEKNGKSPIFNYIKKKGGSSNGLGSSLGENRSDLVRLERDFEAKMHGYSARSYLHVLEEILPTVYDPTEHISMQDNARIHTAKNIKDWLQNNSINAWNVPPTRLT
jgi:hypothetical protein